MNDLRRILANANFFVMIACMIEDAVFHHVGWSTFLCLSLAIFFHRDALKLEKQA